MIEWIEQDHPMVCSQYAGWVANRLVYHIEIETCGEAAVYQVYQPGYLAPMFTAPTLHDARIMAEEHLSAWLDRVKR